jgi:WD repeat-containing protein 23
MDWYRDAHGSSWLAYASITPRVYLVRLDSDGEQQALCFAAPAGLSLDQGGASALGPLPTWPTLLDAENSYGLGIWSVRFRPDGTELLGGASHTGHVFGDLILYNLERQMPVVSLRAHHDDVNSVAFAGPNLFLSAADDAYIHLWDRRDLRQACGSFVGHTEGITHVSWRGEEVAQQALGATDIIDQRYLVSIGKDQRCKVWDIRLLRDSSQVEQPRPSHYDYRWNDILNPPLDTRRTLRGDTSLFTFIGMRVLSTLIRAYFSPLSTTSGRYIYTGSQDGRICLFDTISGMPLTALRGHEAAVREMSWSPRLPGVLVSAGWDGQAVIWRPAGVEDV